MNDNELLSAYIDGELTDEQELHVQTRLESEPKLQKQLQQLCLLEASVNETFDDMLNEPVPDKLKNTLQAPNNVIPFTRRLKQWRPMQSAAAVLLLLFGGLWLSVQESPDALSAHLPGDTSPVLALLDHIPSHTYYQISSFDETSFTPLLSFTNQQQQYCREYQVNIQHKGLRGIACKTSKGWQTQVIAKTESALHISQYHTVSATDPLAITAYVNQHMQGMPLDKEEEISAIQKNWVHQ